MLLTLCFRYGHTFTVAFDGNDVLGIKHGPDAKKGKFDGYNCACHCDKVHRESCYRPDGKTPIEIIPELQKLCATPGIQLAYLSKLNVIDDGERMFEKYHTKKMKFIKNNGLTRVFGDRVWFVSDKCEAKDFDSETRKFTAAFPLAYVCGECGAPPITEPAIASDVVLC